MLPIDRLLPDAHLQVVDTILAPNQITLVLTATTPTAACPVCRQPAARVQSCYTRTLADLPLADQHLVLQLRVRRFHCRTPQCPRWIFAEQFPALARPWARRTTRLTHALQQLGLALGGTAGARLARKLCLPTSPDTLLRLVRQFREPERPVPQILGVDDWARRRGRTYGTILCDLETGQPIDLLPDRRADTLVAWLLQHPGVRIISRDRAGAYAEAAHRGAPQAQQIADRWHLLKNLGDALARVVARVYATLRPAVLPPVATPPPGPPPVPPSSGPAEVPLPQPARPAPAAPLPTPREQRLQQERRAQRLAAYETACTLRQHGWSIQAIAQQLGRDRGTISQWVQSPSFPEIQPRAPRPSQLAPYLLYLHQRWQAGCHNAQHLFHELSTQGYTGGRTVVAAYVTRLRRGTGAQLRQDAASAPPRSAAERLPGVQQLRWLLSRSPATLTSTEQDLVRRLCQHSRDLTIAYGLALDGQQIIREQHREHLASWIAVAQASGVAEMISLAQGIVRDFSAVAAALELPWSNGPVEGHVNRLKMLKRQLYGRANFDLLRLRVLYA